ncbi:MAG: DUF86 domain-containing protein [Clostridiales bacterium]|nr:DUF86 domain-containing protein [Clostridiales bacterium]
MSEIKNNIEKVRKYASLPEKEFWGDERNILSVKHLLLESIEACGSICVHILAKKVYRAPSSFAECFEHLNRAGIINEELSLKLQNMARFRNILVHRYWEVDEKKILEYARNNLEDFEQFLRATVSYLQMT